MEREMKKELGKKSEMLGGKGIWITERKEIGFE
jgi:hypothetical protein